MNQPSALTFPVTSPPAFSFRSVSSSLRTHCPARQLPAFNWRCRKAERGARETQLFLIILSIPLLTCRKCEARACTAAHGGRRCFTGFSVHSTDRSLCAVHAAHQSCSAVRCFSLSFALFLWRAGFRHSTGVCVCGAMPGAFRCRDLPTQPPLPLFFPPFLFHFSASTA